MKKIITFIMTTVLVLTMSMTALATNGGFVVSPSLNGTPELIKFESSVTSCLAEWIITSYANRDSLSPEKKSEIEKCYDIISKTDNAMKLTEELKSLMGDAGAVLAVSDLFNLSYIGCDTHDEHGKTTFTLKADTLKNFRALLCYSAGAWHVVEGASVDGDLLTFSTDTFTIFAVLVDVDTAAGDDTVDTGDNGRFLLYGAVMVASLTGIVSIIGVKAYSGKKSKR